MFQYISHYTPSIGYVDGIRMALEGGCKWVQLRMKDAPEEEVLACAKEALPLCRQHGARFILDDHVELVETAGADGVHLGLHRQGADYIGCGPFRFTTTKKKLSPVLGLEGYRDIVLKMRENGIDLPIVAIGGITVDDIPAIMGTGVTGIALSGAILNAEDPKSMTESILETLKPFEK